MLGVYLVGIADGDESFDGEAEYERGRQVLRDEVDERVALADGRVVDGAARPGVLELLQDVQQQEQRVVDGQHGQVDRRRVVATHAPASPDPRRQHVPWTRARTTGRGSALVGGVA